LNWFIPALVNISVGSFFTTMGAEGTIVCPLDRKKSRKAARISELVIMVVACGLITCVLIIGVELVIFVNPIKAAKVNI
jgi:hypothetical protein